MFGQKILVAIFPLKKLFTLFVTTSRAQRQNRMMRLSVFATLFLLLTSALSAQPSGDSPVDYINYLNELEENLSKKYLPYMSEVVHGNRARKMETRRVELLNSVTDAIQAAGRLKPHKDDDSMRDA